MNPRLEEHSHCKVDEFINLNLWVLGGRVGFYIPVNDIRLNGYQHVVKGEGSVQTRKEGQEPAFAASVQTFLAVHTKQVMLKLPVALKSYFVSHRDGVSARRGAKLIQGGRHQVTGDHVFSIKAQWTLLNRHIRQTH
jgi:hypothetical protein